MTNAEKHWVVKVLDKPIPPIFYPETLTINLADILPEFFQIGMCVYIYIQLIYYI